MTEHLCPLDHGADDQGNACLICSRPLRGDEVRCCNRCINGALLDLTDIEHAYAELPTVVESSGYRMHAMPGGDALVMYVDGSVEGGGPDDWISDPTPVLAVLESNERDWRHTFGHPPAVELATVSGSANYLRRWMWLAARTHEAFDDYVREIRTLKARLEHVAGLADDPEKAAAQCFDCKERLLRRYGDKGLADEWECAGCHREYDQAAYFLALRAAAAASEGYVPLAEAARAAHVAAYIVRNWYDRGQLAGFCQVFPRHRHMVWWPDVYDRVEALRLDRNTAV